MGLAQILIKFTGQHVVGNIVSALALEPEILIPVEYGRGMSEKERGRLNHLFHKRGMPTIVAEPVILERYMEADMETRLETLFEKYRDRKPVVDISDADVMQSMAVGAVLARHQYWSVAVMDLKIRERLFFPLKNAAHLRRMSFPTISESEFRFLLKSEAELQRSVIMTRPELTKEAAKRIRILGRFYAESPTYWKDLSQRFRYAAGDADEGRREFIMDTRSMGIRDSVFEDLRDIGIFDIYERKGGIVRYRFTNKAAMGMLLHITDIPLFNVFLLAAQIREYGKNAAFTDLALYDYSYVSGIMRCCPFVIRVFREDGGSAQLVELDLLAAKIYGGISRKVLVYYSETGLTDEIRKAAKDLEIELVYAGEMITKLEPR